MRGQNSSTIEPGSVIFPGDGEMARSVREKDWSQTPLGPVATWPDSIRTAVGIALESDFQLVVLSSPEFVYIYNDASISIFGDKHPWALGRRAADVWAEAWDAIGPLLNTVFTTGKATRRDDLLLVLQRRGFVEECYFTFSYSPIRSAGNAIEGVFVAVLETSERVISERRLRTLSELAGRVAAGHGNDHAFDALQAALAGNPYDLPFAALYLSEGDGKFADLAFCTGLEGGALSAHIPLAAEANSVGEHPVAAAARTSEPLLFPARVMLDEAARCGAWPEQPRQALALPFTSPGQQRPRGVLVVGLNPRRKPDQEYRAFLDLVAGHIATAVANAEAAQAERRRVEAMAELDRSKSVFFSNASHELRTPVTLILGPLEEILDCDDGTLTPSVRARLDVARRNADRLHKLVNAIMDFASIEAGRLLLRLEPTDIGALTAEVASLFSDAVKAAGLEFSVQCANSAKNALVDREMWEKLVLNLVANAARFTRQGRIEVVLRTGPDVIDLMVRDTGLGIDQEDLPHIFDRFYRGRTATSRSIEGHGIGLSLVHELVRLHGGRIDVESALGQGSTFHVRIPLRLAEPGTAREKRREIISAGASRAMGHLFPDEVKRDAQMKNASGRSLHAPPTNESAAPRQTPQEQIRVLVIDDNEDIVRYIERLLSNTCSVIPAYGGLSGLEAIRRCSPDLVLMDVMMPDVDGFDLLRTIRADDAIHTISVIVLSARAGEEARLEALDAGADDYLVKPFNARELVARVRSHVQMVRVRRAAIEREGALLRQIADVKGNLERVLEGTTDAFISLDRDLRIVALNETAAQLVSARKRDLIGRLSTEVSPDIRGSKFEQALLRAMEQQSTASVEHFHVPSGRWFNVRCYPAPHGVIAFGDDITERKAAEEALRAAHAGLEKRVAERTQELQQAGRLLSAVFDRAPGGIAIADTGGRFIRANAAYQALVGYTEEELAVRSMESVSDPDDYPQKRALMRQLLSGERETAEMEMRYLRADHTTIWVSIFVSTIVDEEQRPRYFVKIVQDITDRKHTEREILASQAELRMLYDRLQSVREAERVATAREVHDQLGQFLSAAKIDIKLLEDDARPSDAPLSRRKILKELRSAGRTLDQAIDSVRQIAMELRAPVLEDQGLYAAIAWHARDFERRTRIKCSVALPQDVREPKGAIAITLFRIFQEALTNVLRHAKASRIWVSLVRRGGCAVLRVRDDGIGISRRNMRSTRSLGLTGMRERAAIAHGRLMIGALRSGGTLVSARIPLAGEKKRGGAAKRRSGQDHQGGTS